MTLPPLFWPWDFFDTCMGNVPHLDLCLKWTVELYAWQAAVALLVVVGLWLLIRNYGGKEEV